MGQPVNMTKGWVSPWNGLRLSADELIDEVALAAVSRLYVLSELGFLDHQLTIEIDSIVIKSPTIDYCFIIYYPGELYEAVIGYFSTSLLSLKKEYGIDVDMDGLKRPSGEKMGEMLRYFDTFERLVRTVSARHCWDPEKILAIHGIRSSKFLSKLKSDLDQAAIRYLLMYPLGEDSGSGYFKTIGHDTAEIIVRDLRAGRAGVIERLFDLEHDYGSHALVSNDNNLIL